MSTNALNQVYKTAIVAVEESLLTASPNAGATSIAISGKYMSATPFTVNQTYILRDDSFAAGANGLPNSERIMVTSIAGLTATPLADGIGFTVAGTLAVLGYSSNGWTGGILNSYTTTNNASVLTPGKEMAIQSADFNCRFKTLADTPKIDFDDESSRFATGDEGRDLSIAGARSGEITFTEKLAWGGAVTTVPRWEKLMRIMGHVTKKYTTTGIEFLPLPHANEVTGTVWIISPENGAAPAQVVYRYVGAHGGNGSSISTGKIGDPWMMTGKLNAAYIGTLELPVGKTRALTGPQTTIPEVMLSNLVTVPAAFGASLVPSASSTLALLITSTPLAANSRFFTSDGSDTGDAALATAKLLNASSSSFALSPGDSFTVSSSSAISYAQPIKAVEISQFSLDFGQTVNPFIDQATTTGNAFYVTSDRDPRFTCNPYHVSKSQEDLDLSVTQMMTGQVLVKSALTNPHITVEMPNAQLLSPSLASREGYVNTNRTYRPMRNNLGAGAKQSALPDAAMYGILIGARS